MISWILLAVATISFVELLLRLGLLGKVAEITQVAQRSAYLIRSNRISDHWKERALPRYSGRMFKLSLTLLILLCIAFAPFLVAALLGRQFGIPFTELTLSWIGLAASCVLALVYVKLRGRYA